ncbi:unnamed protein product, partial [Ectocarpus sp. 13 AM-2016]
EAASGTWWSQQPPNTCGRARGGGGGGGGAESPWPSLGVEQRRECRGGLHPYGRRRLPAPPLWSLSGYRRPAPLRAGRGGFRGE